MPVPVYTSDVAAPTVFHLLGTDEVDMTHALGWALARCDPLRRQLLVRVLGEAVGADHIHRVDLQRSITEKGRTDIEMHGPDVAVVVEAKKGMSVPGEPQLSAYAGRLAGATWRALVSLSDLPAEVAVGALPATVSGTPVVHLTWQEVVRMARTGRSAAGLADRRLLNDLVAYLEDVIVNQRISSNETWVFALSRQPFIPGALSSVDMVERHLTYTHPLKAHWPKTPSNYVGFRYDGHLQSLHHVETWRIVHDIHEAAAAFPAGAATGLFLAYTLGPPMRPGAPVRSGLPRDTRVRAHIDLLLTSATVRDAAERTRAREAAELTAAGVVPVPVEPVADG